MRAIFAVEQIAWYFLDVVWPRSLKNCLTRALKPRKMYMYRFEGRFWVSECKSSDLKLCPKPRKETRRVYN